MTPDNPFGETNDPDSTVRIVRASAPASLAARPASTAVRPPRSFGAEAVDGGAEAAFAIAATNPLVGVASPLLWLISRLGDGVDLQDVTGLQDRIMAELRRFESVALAKGIGAEAVRLARYVLCATLDDVVMSTDWGSHSDWSARTLVSTLYNEALGGEHFFNILNQLIGDPNAHADLLELMAICISLGFVGKYRVIPDGLSQLARLRDELHRMLRRVRGSFDRDLSADWRAIPNAGHRPPPSPRNMWIVAALALLTLGGLYVTFSLTLRAQADVVIGRLDGLVPEPVVITPPVKAVPAPLPPPPPPLTQLERIQAVLQDEIDRGIIQVISTDKTVVIRISGRALFGPGKDSVVKDSLGIVANVAKAVGREAGPIQVIGHADSLPMSRIGNQELSRIRAEAVRRILAETVTPENRLSADGHGSSDPIASNATFEGRERNRRVEVIIDRTDPVAPSEVKP